VNQFWISNKPLIEAILINIGLAFSQYVVLRAGVFSVATIGLAGVGGYTAGLCSLRLGLPYPVALLGGMAMSTGVSLLLGWPLSRLRGIFQAVATLAFVLVLQTMMLDLTGLTGGSFGLNGIPREVQTWHLMLAVVVMAFLLVNLGRTRPGRAFDAIGGDETAAVTHGISVRRYQFMAFGLSGLFAGLSGGLLAFQNYSVEPTQFGFAPTIDVLIYVVLGGTVSVLGPIVGTTVFMALPEVARPFAANRDIIVGVVLIFVVIYLQDGVVDSLRRLWRDRRARRARERRDGADAGPPLAWSSPPTTPQAVKDHAEA
jgi:branched-chain amino acid transport system permease protein